MSGIGVQEYLDRYQPADRTYLALDVGCGLANEYRLSPVARLVGVDILKSSLVQNNMLHYQVIGDAQALPFNLDQFDIIFCSYVLEHLPDPEAAILGMFASVKENGLIVIDIPNLYSLKSLMAKFTPLWFHRWVYRRILNKPDAGKDGKPPHKTYLRYSMRVDHILELGRVHGLTLLHLETQDARDLLKLHSMIMYRLYDLVERLLSILLFGRLGDSEATIILQKRPF